jgi:hypothetical protein
VLLFKCKTAEEIMPPADSTSDKMCRTTQKKLERTYYMMIIGRITKEKIIK